MFLCDVATDNRAMTPLQTLRNTTWLARLVLLWFALTLGVAVASPMVVSHDASVICTSAGMVKLTVNSDGSLGTELDSAAHCPLCVVGSSAPPMSVAVVSETYQPTALVLQSMPATYVGASTAPPPPSRGPPASQ
jgi:hypothetical protein